MKDEFKEMLKLFGVSPEVAENLLPSGEQRQGEQQTQSDKIQKIRACVPEGSGVQSVARTVVRRSRRAALYFSRMAIVRIIWNLHISSLLATYHHRHRNHTHSHFWQAETKSFILHTLWTELRQTNEEMFLSWPLYCYDPSGAG